jgi:hypothetical protein
LVLCVNNFIVNCYYVVVVVTVMLTITLFMCATVLLI